MLDASERTLWWMPALKGLWLLEQCEQQFPPRKDVQFHYMVYLPTFILFFMVKLCECAVYGSFWVPTFLLLMTRV